jgi:hypothetical protein
MSHIGKQGQHLLAIPLKFGPIRMQVNVTHNRRSLCGEYAVIRRSGKAVFLGKNS